MLPRVPRDIRILLVKKMLEILVCEGLGDLPDEDYLLLSEDLCELIRQRKKRECSVPEAC